MILINKRFHNLTVSWQNSNGGNVEYFETNKISLSFLRKLYVHLTPVPEDVSNQSEFFN